MPRDVLVTPDCCETVRRSRAVFLAPAFEADKPPVWMCRAPRGRGHGRWAAAFCPHCGAGVPPLAPADPRDRVCRVGSDGIHCDTCRMRLDRCDCLPPEAAWRPAPEARP